MKNIVFSILLLLSTTSVFSQSPVEIEEVLSEYSKSEIAEKAEKFQCLRSSGIGMLISGVIALPTGIFMMSRASWESYSNGGESGMTTSDPIGGVGIVFLAVGIPLTVAGTVLTIIGAKKAKLYRAAGKGFSLGMNPGTKTFCITWSWGLHTKKVH